MAAAGPSDPDDIITGINVTPLVDIVLVLLIIFMLTANLIARASIEVELPQASTGAAAEPTTVAFTLTAEGQLYLNGVATDEGAARQSLRQLARQDPKAQAVIAADRVVPHGKVVWLIDLIRQEGILKFAINIDPQGSVPANPSPRESSRVGEGLGGGP